MVKLVEKNLDFLKCKWGGRNYHPLSENRDFSGTEPPLDLRPVCKLKFVRCGPGEKKQSALSFWVEAWPPDEVREHLFPNSEIEIFIDFRQISQIFKKFSGDQFKS